MELKTKIFLASGSAFVLSLAFTKILAFTLSYYKKLDKQRNLIIDTSSKSTTPSMGGIAIILSILIVSFFLLPIKNKYSQLLIFTTTALGLIGFCDDYKKVFKKNKTALKPRTKLLLQAFVGVVVALVSIEKGIMPKDIKTNMETKEDYCKKSWLENIFKEKIIVEKETKNFLTSIPFSKKYVLDYSAIVPFLGEKIFMIIFILIVIFIISASSNAANLMDGMDGVTIGFASVFSIGMIFLSFVALNFELSQKFTVIHIPHSESIFLYSIIFFAACLGFWWENSYPATIFMGDVGSLFIGGIIAVIMILLRQELLIPIIGLVMVIENISVILQVYYFKYTKKKFGIGKKIFLCAPIHHHFQAKGIHENKITIRILIITIISLVSVVYSIFF